MPRGKFFGGRKLETNLPVVVPDSAVPDSARDAELGKSSQRHTSLPDNNLGDKIKYSVLAILLAINTACGPINNNNRQLQDLYEQTPAGQVVPPTHPNPTEIRVVADLSIEEELFIAMQGAGLPPSKIQEWFGIYAKRYGCPVDVVKMRLGVGDGQPGLLQRGDPGVVYLYPDAIGQVSLGSSDNPDDSESAFTAQAQREKVLALVLARSFSHACRQPPTESQLGAGLWLTDNLEILGTRGLHVVLQDKEGRKLYFKAIDEAMVEVLSAYIVPRYQSFNLTDYNVGMLMLELMKRTNITDSELAQILQKNDLPGFMTRVLGRSDPLGLVKLMIAFNQAYNDGEQLTPEQIEAIVEELLTDPEHILTAWNAGLSDLSLSVHSLQQSVVDSNRIAYIDWSSSCVPSPGGCVVQL